jgi:hypothetical protein
VQLLQILDQQLELLINKEKSDLHFLFILLKAETLVSEKKYKKLKITFSLEAVSYSCAIKRTRTNSNISNIKDDTKKFFKYRR